ncbi:uncharacterized protein LOC141909322 [Tubulanus polymorphus]|uniref:uncharacterized protein LOC141909322 n=1 Tax=Tubulanus polymorphus TaxID=672921 RepID=UPI003DA534DF
MFEDCPSFHGIDAGVETDRFDSRSTITSLPLTATISKHPESDERPILTEVPQQLTHETSDTTTLNDCKEADMEATSNKPKIPQQIRVTQDMIQRVQYENLKLDSERLRLTNTNLELQNEKIILEIYLLQQQNGVKVVNDQ